MRIFRPRRNGASKSAGGTHVVLPLPGGARSTTERLRASDARICGMIASTGKDMFYLSRRYAALSG